jgi:hypothetical protein
LTCGSDADSARPFLPDATHTLAEILGLGQPGGERERKGEKERKVEKERVSIQYEVNRPQAC